MDRMILTIEGMTCNHCVQTVQRALSAVPGVQKAEVDLAQQKAFIEFEDPLDLPAAIKAVEEEGYKAKPLS